jgi:hypothetical protein
MPYSNPADPAYNAFSITASDSTNLPATTRAIYIGVSGNMSVVMADGGVVQFSNIPAGAMLPLRVIRVNATGTSAAGLIGLI